MLIISLSLGDLKKKTAALTVTPKCTMIYIPVCKNITIYFVYKVRLAVKWNQTPPWIEKWLINNITAREYVRGNTSVCACVTSGQVTAVGTSPDGDVRRISSTRRRAVINSSETTAVNTCQLSCQLSWSLKLQLCRWAGEQLVFIAWVKAETGAPSELILLPFFHLSKVLARTWAPRSLF